MTYDTIKEKLYFAIEYMRTYGLSDTEIAHALVMSSSLFKEFMKEYE